MKKILLTSVALLIFITSYSQGFRTGLKLAANTTWLLNANVFDAGDQIDVVASFGADFGATGTYMFNETFGISLDVFYSSVNQHYKGVGYDIGGLPSDYTVKEKLRYLDLPLMLKLTSDKGPFFEIGPKFSFLMNQTEEYNGEFVDYEASYKSDFNSTLIAIALGFGVDISVAEHMFINVGLRLAYNPGSALKDLGEDAFTGFNSHSYISKYSSFDEGDPDGNDAVYKFEKSHVATAGLLVGFTYEFGD